MDKLKDIKEPINFQRAGELFNLLSRINEIKVLREKDILKRFKFLQHSIKNTKDISELNPTTLDSLYVLGLNKKKLSQELYLSLLPSCPPARTLKVTPIFCLLTLSANQFKAV